MRILSGGNSERIEAVSVGVQAAKLRIAELERYASLIPHKRPSGKRLPPPRPSSG